MRSYQTNHLPPRVKRLGLACLLNDPEMLATLNARSG
jgi:hypothetical protein